MSSPPPVITPPGSNVTPMWGGTWPGRPPAVPPNCFSQLYGLNQCYDDIIMMQQILQKVICDMATNNTEFAQCLAAGIAKVGAGSPVPGVTDGSNAQPGIVGEYLTFELNIAYTTAANEQQQVSLGVLPPGDWTVWSWAVGSTFTGGIGWYLNPAPPGFSNTLYATNVATAATTPLGTGDVYLSTTARASISVPTLLAFTVGTNLNGDANALAGTLFFHVEARRTR